MTPRLGDSFPEETRQAYCRSQLLPGAVFRLHVEFTDPPKTKFVVVLGLHTAGGFGDSVGLLTINSAINPNIFRTAQLRMLHVPCNISDYNFLSHDSYVDCSDIHEMSYGDILRQFCADISMYAGQLTDSNFSTVVATVHSAVTIPPKLKRKYGCL